MSKFEKAKDRLKSEPKDFKWSELRTVLIHLGFKEIQGSGSRVKFHDKDKGLVCSFHKPHPNPDMKSYAVREALAFLIDNGYIEK